MGTIQEIAFEKACNNAGKALQRLSRELRYILREMPTDDIVTLIKEMPAKDREQLYRDSLINEDYEICKAFHLLIEQIR